jgi:hypothetical protein
LAPTGAIGRGAGFGALSWWLRLLWPTDRHHATFVGHNGEWALLPEGCMWRYLRVQKAPNRVSAPHQAELELSTRFDRLAQPAIEAGLLVPASFRARDYLEEVHFCALAERRLVLRGIEPPQARRPPRVVSNASGDISTGLSFMRRNEGQGLPPQDSRSRAQSTHPRRATSLPFLQKN